MPFFWYAKETDNINSCRRVYVVMMGRTTAGSKHLQTSLAMHHLCSGKNKLLPAFSEHTQWKEKITTSNEYTEDHCRSKIPGRERQNSQEFLGGAKCLGKEGGGDGKLNILCMASCFFFSLLTELPHDTRLQESTNAMYFLLIKKFHFDRTSGGGEWGEKNDENGLVKRRTFAEENFCFSLGKR